VQNAIRVKQNKPFGMRYRALIIAGMTCIGLGIAALQLLAGDPSFGTLKAVKTREKLIMISFPRQDSSFVAVNTDTGPMKKLGTIQDFKGFDVDLMAGFAHWLKVPLEIHTLADPSYGELIPALLRGEGDLIACAFSETPERRKLVDFSEPYMYSYNNVIVRQDSLISSQADLIGKRVATMAGASHEERLRAIGIESQHFVHFQFTRDLYEAVRDGQADFFLAEIDEHGLNTRLLHDYKSALKIAIRLPGAQPWGIAFPNGSDLRSRFNMYLEFIRRSGEYDSIVARHVPRPE
jgi:glutamine transport system substrate-binding protein